MDGKTPPVSAGRSGLHGPAPLGLWWRDRALPPALGEFFHSSRREREPGELPEELPLGWRAASSIPGARTTLAEVSRLSGTFHTGAVS